MSVSAFQVSTIATILNGETKSNPIAIKDYQQGAFVTPSALTGTAFTFEVSADNVTFVPLHDALGAAVSITVAASRAGAIPAAAFAFPWLKLVSGSAEGADRVIQLTLKY